MESLGIVGVSFVSLGHCVGSIDDGVISVEVESACFGVGRVNVAGVGAPWCEKCRSWKCKFWCRNCSAVVWSVSGGVESITVGSVGACVGSVDFAMGSVSFGIEMLVLVWEV